jgi:glutamate-1-semialdehyde 2,1-aminomutase
MRFDRSKELRKKSHHLIPGGGHTYAKGDDQYPEDAPGFIVRGEGCHVWDIDGNEFIEYGMGLRAITLGHAYKPVIEAAFRQAMQGQNFVRPSDLEVAAAEDLLSLIDGGEMVKFGKNGSDVTSAALRLARAYTGRDLVAICAEHPFFSIDDWFIGSTPMNAGVPEAIRKLTLKFKFNDIESLKTFFAEHPNQIACVMMEAATAIEPAEGFLEHVQKLCRQDGAVLVFDEMITGFRWHLGGAQKFYGIVPDLSTFGKALGNGFSVSALVGKREIMKLGGLDHDQPRVFILSLTHGAESHGLAAAREVIRVYRTENVVERLWQTGEQLRRGINQVIAQHGLGEYFSVLGRPCNLVYATRDRDKQPSQPFRTLFLQETIARGLLMPSLVVSLAHKSEDIARTVDGIDQALGVYARALDDGIDKYLKSRPVKPVFRTYN